MRCFVLWCRNSSLNHPKGVKFHKIPEDRYGEWLEAIKRTSDTLPLSSRRIFSEHFTLDSFIPIRGRLRTFKPHVISTLKLTQSQLLMRSRNGFNNNPTPYQFNNTFKILMLYHDIKQDGGNCLGLDITSVLTLQSISKPKQREVSIVEKYGFNHEEVIDDHDYGQEFASFFDIITENVLVYVAGLVIEKIKTVIECAKCFISRSFCEYDKR